MRHPTLPDTRAAKATMPPNWLLAAGCRMGRLLIRRKADDLTDDEFVFRPAPGTNSAAWSSATSRSPPGAKAEPPALFKLRALGNPPVVWSHEPARSRPS
jgi:hypothetical protein